MPQYTPVEVQLDGVYNNSHSNFNIGQDQCSTSLYGRKDALEQIVLSLNVQLLIKEYDLTCITKRNVRIMNTLINTCMPMVHVERSYD